MGALLRAGTLSQAELPSIIDIAQPSAARLVGTLSREGYIEILARKVSAPGNPSVSLKLNADAAYAIGIGIVGDAVSIVLLDLAGEVRIKRRVGMADMSRLPVLARIKKMLAEIVKESGIDQSRIVGAGVGFSGFFVGNPTRFNPPSQLTDWAHVDVAETLSEALQMPVICDNDGTTAAIAEALLGVGRTSSNFAYCHLTNGFGGGLIVNGKPLRGEGGNAADFGGAWWLLNQGYPDLEHLRDSITRAGEVFPTVEDMIREITPQTPGVEEWLSEAYRPFGMLASLLGHILAPQKVVIGGRLPPWLATELAERLRLPQTPARNGESFPLPAVVPTQVPHDAVAIGGGAMALQELFFD
jgi:predicted NBD/HSP70 family sugar kinase